MHAPVIPLDGRRCEVIIVDESDMEGTRRCNLLDYEHEVSGYAISAETRTQLIDLLEGTAGQHEGCPCARDAAAILPHIKGAPFIYGVELGVSETTCEDCGEPLTVYVSDDDVEPTHVFCDLCGRAEHPADLTPDWNGDTGNHLSCEAARA